MPLSGGVVPPALLPEALRRLSAVSPIAWLRALSAAPLGYDAPRAGASLAAAAAALCLLCAALYPRKADGEEAAL